MKRRVISIALAGVLAACASNPKMKEAPMDGGKLYEFKMKDIDGNSHSLAEYKGKVLLIVNVASKCGNTPQYKGLEETYQKYHDQGFEILGFPANNFGKQEPGSDAQIKEFCTLTYGVKFPMFSKISVKGADIDPLYTYLTSQPGFEGEIGWNFAKFLVNRQGKVVARIEPGSDITEPANIALLKSAL